MFAQVSLISDFSGPGDHKIYGIKQRKGNIKIELNKNVFKLRVECVEGCYFSLAASASPLTLLDT